MSRKEKRSIALLALMGIHRSLAETVSTGAVLPYMVALIDTEKAETMPVLKSIARIAGGSETKFILCSTLLFLALYALRCAYLVFYDYVNGRIIRDISSTYSVRLFRYYMTRPYRFFFDKNSSLLQRNVTSVISGLMQGVISNGLYLLSYGLTVVLLLGVIVASGVPGLLAAALILCLIYVFLSRNIKKRTKEIADEANSHSRLLHRTVMECFRGIKDFKLCADEENVIGFVSGEYAVLNELRVKRKLINSIPNQILELGTVMILALILIGGNRSGNMSESVALLSLCGASAIRIRSALSGILSKVTAIKDNSAYYDEIIDDIRASVECDGVPSEGESPAFKDRIEIRNVSYRYPGGDREVFRNFSLTIRKGESVGIVGHSGKGKTTLADLLTGLISPQNGELLIDGVSLRGRESAWQKSVGYVPQDIFLIDGSILKNIALYEPEESVDRERARKALKMAQLLDYVDSLPERENSLIGENGLLISGGQKQRIGIARALYRNPEILIFDEATNSLDCETEQAFINTLHSLSGEYTMIVISHRSETMQNCGRIVNLNDREATELAEG